jgi:ABC-2 type transport system ATP-binding protein
VLFRSYEGKVHALSNVSFSFPDRGILAIIGRNGAGKTTLVRILATELMPSKGTASIYGIDVIKEPKRLREMIAIVPQEARAIPWLTPWQTIFCYLLYRGFSHSEASKHVRDSLRMLNLELYTNTVNRKLSGGIKRKVLVATVLASEAKVLFLDEPTTGLDPISRNDLWRVLNELKKEYLIVLTTHYLEEAERLADVVGIIEQGRLMAFGTVDELRKMTGHQYSIRIMTDKKPVKVPRGALVNKFEGNYQIMTSEKEAFRMSEQLIRSGIKFSTNPITLEDIFYYTVKKSLDSDVNYGDSEW